MGRHFLIILFLCFLALRGSYASISPQDYWQLKLPKTHMPQSIKDSLAPSGGGIGSLTTMDSLASTNGYKGLLSYAKDSAKNSLASTNGYKGLLSYAKDSNKNSLASTSGYKGFLSYAKESSKTSLASTNGYKGLLSYAKGFDKNSLASTNGYRGFLSYAKDSAKTSLASTNGYKGLLSYSKTKSKNEVPKAEQQFVGKDDSNPESTAANVIGDRVFFVEENLKNEEKMTLVFKKGTKKSIFLPRDIANKIPFSSHKLEATYKILSLDPKSHEAYVLSRRVELCEEPMVEGVEKQCVTSLESMVDFVVNKIGKNVKALSTKVDKDHLKMEYTIKEVKKIAKNDHETVVCHKMGYPYALFFCHGTATIRSYMVKLVATDGTQIKAVVACHKETNDFLKNYMINVLKVVPGSTRVCHFPDAEDSIIWVAN